MPLASGHSPVIVGVQASCFQHSRSAGSLVRVFIETGFEKGRWLMKRGAGFTGTPLA